MHILCFHLNQADTTYSQSLLTNWPQTTVLIDDRRDFRQAFTIRLFDIVLLTCNDRDLKQVAYTWQMARIVREQQPQCLIMIHRYPSGPRPPWFLLIPPSLYDFLFDNYLQPSFLPLLAATLAHRRKDLLPFYREIPAIKGMIAMEPVFSDILEKSLSKNNLIAITTEVDNDFETQFRRKFPDFAVLHCHNRNGDFDIVKQATHTIRRLHPGCILYLTCSNEVIEEYAIRYRFHEYFYDELLPLPLGGGSLLTKLIHQMARRYHPSFSLPIKKPPCIA